MISVAGIIVGLSAIITVLMRDVVTSDCGRTRLHSFITDDDYICEGPHYGAPILSLLLILAPWTATRGPPRLAYSSYIIVFLVLRISFWHSACADFRLGNGSFMCLLTMILSAASAAATDKSNQNILGAIPAAQPQYEARSPDSRSRRGEPVAPQIPTYDR